MKASQFVLSAILGCTLALTSAVASADMARGEKLHSDNCTACHASNFGGDGSTIYTRPDRRVTTYAGLHKQVTRCKDMLGFTWFDDEVKDVVEHLNTTYYKFQK